MQKHRRLHDASCFPGLRPATTTRAVFGDPKARILRLHRRGKTVCGVCDTVHRLRGGRRCRASSIKDVAKELRRAGTPAPRIVGIDEVSIRKGHTYRIVVSDLVRQRPIWFGGTNRSEASMDAFYRWPLDYAMSHF